MSLSFVLRARSVAWLGALGALGVAAGCSTADQVAAPSVVDSRPSLAAAAAPPAVRFSEIHYDNAGADAGETIEVSGPAGTDLTGWSVVLYNGSGGAAYNTRALSGTVPNSCDGRGVVVLTYPADGIQNGSPDGFALVDAAGQVVEFLSYEGTFAAVGGPANGQTSTDIGVSEVGTTPAGQSLARNGAGAWSAPAANTFGACNDNTTPPSAEVASVAVTPATASIAQGATQQFTATAYDASNQPIANVAFTWSSANQAVATVNTTGLATGVQSGTTQIVATAPNGVAGSAALTVTGAPTTGATNVRVTEFHYDNESTDAGEAIELEGDAGGSLAGWSLVLYSGSTGSTSAGQSYATLPLSGTFGSSCGGARGVLVVDAPGLQNGDKDGFAVVNAAGQVVEFLSYEGSFAATNGPAAGLTATDVGVDEDPAPAAGRSLQRAGNGAWYGPYPATFGACNPAAPPPPQTGVTFSGRLPNDPALPVGFQDQLFATLRDANSGATVPTTFTWASETPAVATVDQRGVITALAAGTVVVRATAADGTTGTLSLPVEVAPAGDASLYKNALTFGTPTDADPSDDLRVSRAQYELAYSRARNTPNWVAYQLSRATRGDLPGYRCDCFTTDPRVTASGEVGITTADYTGSGFDRGHMVRSNDRELGRFDQATTYYMSNIVPQYAAQNQGRWADLESYLQTVVEGAGSPEVYIFAGPRGEAGRIAGGRVAVPTHTWKVAVVLPAGMTPTMVDEASDILDLIAVDMPNVADLPRDGNWQAHKTTVDAIEALTGYDVLSALPNLVENVVESGDRKPTARAAGPAAGDEGQALTFDGSASSDPDVGGALNDALTYAWSVDGAAAGTQATLTRTFADNGAFAVRLIVTDRFGFADTATTAVTIANVAPQVAAFAGDTIAGGETYAASGSFADPGADTWTATVDYGDGTGARPLALSGKSFQLSHRYTKAGTFTVTVTVRDDDNGAAARTATVFVKSARQVVADIKAWVLAEVAAGRIDRSQGNALVAALDAIDAQLARGNTAPVIAQLEAFIRQVDAAARAGRIPAADAARLTAFARTVIGILRA